MASEYGSLLREQRERLSLTQKQVAERAKVVERQYQAFENNERNIMTASFQTAGKVLRALELDLTAFYHGASLPAAASDKVIGVGETKEVPSAELLKRRRGELGLTLKEVAGRAGIIIQQYQKLEGGQRELRRATFQTACAVLEALEIDAAEFLGITEKETKQQPTG